VVPCETGPDDRFIDVEISNINPCNCAPIPICVKRFSPNYFTKNQGRSEIFGFTAVILATLRGIDPEQSNFYLSLRFSEECHAVTIGNTDYLTVKGRRMAPGAGLGGDAQKDQEKRYVNLTFFVVVRAYHRPGNVLGKFHV
jgi:hypothetical protein